MTDFNLQAQLRTSTGSSEMRRARRLEDLVPAIVYGGKHEPTMINLDQKKVLHALENEAFYSHILTLEIDGKKENVVIKDIQRHPYKSRIVHMDFYRVSADQKLNMHVPIHFLGADVAPGVINGGAVAHVISEVEIRCLPKYLPEFLELDISKLEMNQMLHLSDIKLPANVELVAKALIEQDPAHHDHVVVSIHPPRAEEEPEELEAAGEEGAEGEEGVEGEAKPDESSESKESSKD